MTRRAGYRGGERDRRCAARRLAGPETARGRLGLSEAIVAMITFLLSAETAYSTGQAIHLGGGLSR